MIDWTTLVAILVTGAAIYYGMSYMYDKGRQEKEVKRRATFKKNVVYLYVYPRWKRGPNISHWCFKLETFLRMAKVPYAVVQVLNGKVSPTERLPMIVYNDEVITDSQMVIEEMTKKLKIKLDSWLTEDQLAEALALRRLVESSTAVCMQRAFFVDNSQLLLEHVMASRVPPFIAKIMVHFARKKIISFLNTHGNGDLPQEFYQQEFLADVKACEQTIKKNGGAYMLGKSPCSIDATVFAVLYQCHACAEAGVTNCSAISYVKDSKTLQMYVGNMSKTYYRDMEQVVDKYGKQEFFMFPNDY